MILLIFVFVQALANVEEKRQFMKDWDTYMRNFVPDDMISFTVPPKSEEVLIERIQSPTNVRGAFVSSLYDKDTFDFKVIDPYEEIVFEKLNVREAVFNFNTTQIGEYQIVFQNLRSNSERTLTFSIDVASKQFESLKPEHLDPVEQKVTNIHGTVMETFYNQKLSSQRLDMTFTSVHHLNQRFMIFTLVETLVIISVTFWQVWYIKSLLNNRRLV